MWRCPTCKSKDHLDVRMDVWARLVQPDEDPEAFETDTDLTAESRDHEWGKYHSMICNNPKCADHGKVGVNNASHFECEPPEDDEEDDEDPGDDLCDLCHSSGVNVSRTTYCGKTIGIECGCEESNEGGYCNEEDCATCNQVKAEEAEHGKA